MNSERMAELLKALDTTLKEIIQRQDIICTRLIFISDFLSNKLDACDNEALQKLCSDLSKYIEIQLEDIEISREIALTNRILTEINIADPQEKLFS